MIKRVFQPQRAQSLRKVRKKPCVPCDTFANFAVKYLKRTMKKAFVFIALTALSLAWLCYSVRQYSEYVLLYALLSIAGYVSFFITLYRRLKKFKFVRTKIGNEFN
jgi:hypothetical protein